MAIANRESEEQEQFLNVIGQTLEKKSYKPFILMSAVSIIK